MAFSKIFFDKTAFEKFKQTVPKTYSMERLQEALKDSIKENCNGIEKAAVLFSGGIDSSLLAKLVSEKVKETKLFTVGLNDSFDIQFSKTSAKLLGLEKKLSLILVDKKEIFNYYEKVKKTIGSNDFLQLQIALPEFIALEKVKQDSFKTVFSAQGVDELFAGYAEFNNILKRDGFNGVQEEIWNKLKNMNERNLKREFALAKHFSLELKTPFLNENFMKEAMAFPPEKKIFSADDILRKRVFRELALSFGIPKKICLKKKKAIQYGSGISKELKNIFKKQ